MRLWLKFARIYSRRQASSSPGDYVESGLALVPPYGMPPTHFLAKSNLKLCSNYSTAASVTERLVKAIFVPSPLFPETRQSPPFLRRYEKHSRENAMTYNHGRVIDYTFYN